MNDEYVLLTEKEEMWAQMLMQVLKDNHIPCASLPVHGAGFVIKTGVPEWLQVYVPSGRLAAATELLRQLFSEESICDDFSFHDSEES